MSEIKSKKNKLKEILTNKSTLIKILLYVIIILANYFWIGNIVDMGNNDDIRCLINDGWKFKDKDNDKTKENVNVKDIKLGYVSYPDTFSLTRKITKDDIKDKKIDSPGIYFGCTRCHVRAYLDGDKIYDKEDKGWFCVPFPREKLGHEITISFEAMRDNSFTSFSDMYIIDENKYPINVIRKGFFQIFFTSFLILLSTILIIAFVWIHSLDVFYVRIFLLAFFTYCVGAWISGNDESYLILLDNNFIHNVYKFYSIFYGAPAAGLFFYTFVYEKRHKFILKIMIGISFGFAFLSTIINLFTRSDRTKYLLIEEFMGLIIIFSGIILIRKEYDKISKKEKAVLRSFICIGSVIVIEIIRYLVCFIVGKAYTAGTILGAGMVIFVVFVAEAYFSYAKEYVDTNVEKMDLTQKAYTDILTGLDNRSKVMEEIDNMKESRKKEYTIINFDLNDLKKINDSKGHKAGDHYLCAFADAMKVYLKSDFYVIGRIGGDEFVALSSSYINENRVEKMISKVASSVRVSCKKKYGYGATFAYGFVASDRKDAIDITEAYLLADKKMYECKRKQKGITE